MHQLNQELQENNTKVKLHKNQAIGVFDSGIGGLTVANAISTLLPNEQIIYFGDTAHLPYGDKSARAIKQYSYMIADFLLEKKCKAVVIACNTASSVAYTFLKELYKDEVIIIDAIQPVINGICQDDSIKKIAIIGTQVTIQSGVYEQRFKAQKPELSLFSLATPLLVPMIEAGNFKDEMSHSILKSYLDRPEFAEADAIVLGCTHYPLIKQDILEVLGRPVKVFDNTDFVAREVEIELRRLYLLADKKTMEDEFYVSDYTETFEKTTRIFYGEKIQLELNNIWRTNV
jgi:glutamate racemase